MDCLDLQDARINNINNALAQLQADAADAARCQSDASTKLATAISNVSVKVLNTSSTTAPLSHIQWPKLKYGTQDKFTGKENDKFKHFCEHCNNYLHFTDPAAGTTIEFSGLSPTWMAQQTIL